MPTTFIVLQCDNKLQNWSWPVRVVETVDLFWVICLRLNAMYQVLYVCDRKDEARHARRRAQRLVRLGGQLFLKNTCSARMNSCFLLRQLSVRQARGWRRYGVYCVPPEELYFRGTDNIATGRSGANGESDHQQDIAEPGEQRVTS